MQLCVESPYPAFPSLLSLVFSLASFSNIRSCPSMDGQHCILRARASLLYRLWDSFPRSGTMEGPGHTTLSTILRLLPPLLHGPAASFPTFPARSWLLLPNSKHGDGTDLPTPEQFTLLIDLLGGNSFGPIRDTVAYRWAKKERLVDPLPTAFTALFLVTFIGLLIPIVDT